MALNERQKEIVRLLEENNQVKVSKLAQTLYASEMTIRRDLEFLENEGFLVRCHGGALPLGNHLLFPIKYRMLISDKEKKAIALSAKQYLRDDITIFFNSSSSCAYLIPYLKDYKNLRVVTNSLYLTSLLKPLNIPCMVTGGDYIRRENCLCGSVTEEFLRGIRPDVSFLSCEGLSENHEITESQESMAQIAKIAVKNSKLCVMLMDSTKIGNAYTHVVCRSDECENVVVVTN